MLIMFHWWLVFGDSQATLGQMRGRKTPSRQVVGSISANQYIYIYIYIYLHRFKRLHLQCVYDYMMQYLSLEFEVQFKNL